MSQMDDIKSNASELADGLNKLGPDRVVALSVHASKDLIRELILKATQLVEQLEAVTD
jgi:aminoglycoside N3'-acetyltransferase